MDWGNGQNNKVNRINPDSKIGGSWVSFHLGEVRRIRDKDWDNLSSHFEIPKNMKDIDFTKIKLKKV